MHDPDSGVAAMEPMSMSMQMTFGSFRDYQLQLLWSSWDIKEEWQFAVSWVIVFLAVVFYHGLHYVIFSLEAAMRINGFKSIDGGDGDIELGSTQQSLYSVLATSVGSAHLIKTTNSRKLRFIHALLAGVRYALALLLMLVAMTYNPGLFMALILGYIAGDFIFYWLSGNAPDSGCH